jgi:ABC-type cobalt transport system substrate-binding protein
MIKYLVILTKIIIITLIALLFSSCKYNGNWGDGIDGTGNVTVEKR